MAFSPPWAAKRELFEIGGIQTQGDEAQDACQTCQNEPKQEALQVIHHDEDSSAQDISTPLAAKRTLFEIGGIQIQGDEAEDACQTFQNEPKQEAMQAFHHDEDSSAQDMAFSPTWATKRELFDIGGIQTQGDEAEDACQTFQNEPKQEALQAIHHDVRPAGKLNSETRCLHEKKGNILPNGTESEECNLKGKATLGSTTPMTPIEKKRLNDKNYRKRRRDEQTKLQEENKNLQEDVQRLSHENAQLKNMIEQLTCRNDQPKSSLVERKAKFEVNFRDDESKKEAMNLLAHLPDMDDIHLKVKKRILKLKGSFDTETVLRMLNWVCDAQLLSKVNVPSMPGPSTVANLRVPPVKLR